MLAECFKSEFLSGDRRRGDADVTTSRLRIQSIGDLGVEATVEGSYGETYELLADFSNLHDDVLGVHCDCPRFSSGVNCKHLWALLRRIEDEYELPQLPLSAPWIEPLETMDFEIGEPLARKQHRANSRVRQADERFSSGADDGRSSKVGWRRQLSGLYSESRDQTAERSSEIRLLKPGQYWFVMALSDSVHHQRLPLHIYRAEHKPGGEWATPIQEELNPQSVASISDPETRDLFGLLEWGTEELYGHYHYDDCYQCQLPEGHLAESLRRLCETGRFALAMSDDYRLSEYQVLRFEGGGSWRFTLSIRPAEEGHLIAEPEIHWSQHEPGAIPQSETRSLASVVAACDSGAIFFQESVGVLRRSDAAHVRSWRRVEPILFRAEELGDFLQQLATLSIVPEVEFAECLGVQQSLGCPKGKLCLKRPEYSGRVAERYLNAELFALYGDQEISANDPCSLLWDEENRAWMSRDLSAESALWQQLSEFKFQETVERFRRQQLQIHRKWLPDLVNHLTEKGWQVVADNRACRRAGSFDVKVKSSEDWFDLSANADFDGQSVSLPDLLKALRKGEQHVVLDDGSHGLLPEEWLKRFADLSSIGDEVEGTVRFGRNQAMLLDMLLAEQESVQVDRGFSSWIGKLKKFSGIKPAKQPRGFLGELRDYQREGLGWLKFLQNYEFGGCLADDMGLGKTIQVLALLEQRRIRRTKDGGTKKPSIAIVPKSLVFNWIEEASKFTPKLKVIDYTGKERAAKQAEFEDCDLIVTTYSTFRLDVETFRQMEFDYAVLDEAQAIKNPNAQATKAVRLIQADHRLAMTGTPVENHLGDLWSLFDFLNPGMLGGTTAKTFRLDKESSGERLQALGTALQPFILRRTKEQVLDELPAKTEMTLYCEMQPKQRKLYNQLRDHYRASLTKKIESVGIKRSKIQVLEALLRLRQAACDPRLIDGKQSVAGAKVEVLLEQLDEILSRGHKVLLFSQFTSLLKLVRPELDSRQVDYEYLDGKTRKRGESVKRFQEDPSCQVFLISLKAGGHGLNLTAADYVYILDPWWNPAVEAQAIDRAHRMGQQRSVSAYRVIAKDTVEEKILRLQETKRELADAIIRADQGLISGLSLDDLHVLFE